MSKEYYRNSIARKRTEIISLRDKIKTIKKNKAAKMNSLASWKIHSKLTPSRQLKLTPSANGK